MGVLTSDTIDFKTTTVSSDKEEHFTMMKGSSYQGAITIISTTNNRPLKYTKQTLQNQREKQTMQQ